MCGIALITNIPSDRAQEPSHQIVTDGLKTLSDFYYRSGVNDATGESDGAGIRFYGLNPVFFQNKFREENLELPDLKEGKFAIGQYFISQDSDSVMRPNDVKRLIAETLENQGLEIIGWRSLNTSEAVNNDALSEAALRKKPGLWQAIIVPRIKGEDFKKEAFEKQVLKAALVLSDKVKKRNDMFMEVVSQSSESIVYKGMILSHKMREFYRDLQDPDFTAHAVTLHSRFATNTAPQWRNAQPCPEFWSHNGELNSAPANAADMSAVLKANNFSGVYPNNKLSDSMQFDADLANTMLMLDIPLEEAFVRLMSPTRFSATTNETRAMLDYFKLNRTPYNGPAFGVAAFNGCFIAKLDDFGLRPSRFAIIKNRETGERRFHAASDDYIFPDNTWEVIQKGELEPGGMIMITPKGDILHTEAILDQIAARYHQEKDNANYFQEQYRNTVFLLSEIVDTKFPLNPELNRQLIAAGWAYENQEVVFYMAENASEKIGAMGDDTNPLHIDMPLHISYFFHQLFAQVSAPSLDSINERNRFTLKTTLGRKVDALNNDNAKQIALNSPILGIDELRQIEINQHVKSYVLDTTFDIPEPMIDSAELLRSAISQLLLQVKQQIDDSPNGGILILSDKNMAGNRAAIPDMIAVAAVRKYLEAINQTHHFSIIADSYQISGPHQLAALLAVGANAVYARGAYEKIAEHDTDPSEKYKNYRKASEKCLLKTMGKMGITDVNNYCNGRFIAALGLDLSDDKDDQQPLIEHPTLAKIFKGIYSPMRGMNLGHVAEAALNYHAFAYNANHHHTMLPRAGHFMPEKDGIKHGYGIDVVNAFTTWLKAEEERATLFRLHDILEKRGYPHYINQNDLDSFVAERGFLDSRERKNGVYDTAYLEKFHASEHFKKLMLDIDVYAKQNPTALHDYLSINAPVEKKDPEELQSQKDIRALLSSGSMSQGALTASAHEMLTRGMNAIGAQSASGEGGEAPDALRNPLQTTSNKQIASGRFGVSAMQILCADEIEIKITQGAKPGEGGEVHGGKVSIRFAAQRSSLPGVPLISPPPHHDIYSIEDIKQLIDEIKSVNPNVKVCVKLTSSEGIGTIAAGVAKAGADIINVAGNSGGTGAAQQSSIFHAGLPAEIGVAEVDRALQKIGYRDLVQIRTSGGFKTANDVIKAAILGADLFEFGTTAMITMGCKMQRTCNKSCQPGVANDEHLFKGDQTNVERYFVNMAAAIQEKLCELGVGSLKELRGRTDLLTLDPNAPKEYKSAILDRSNLPAPLTAQKLADVKVERDTALKREKEKENELIEELRNGFVKKSIVLTTQDRAFGARIAGAFAKELEEQPGKQIILNTSGCAGQGFAAFMPKGMTIIHDGPVNDGCAKSMSGGTLVIRTPKENRDSSDQNTIAGNAMLYGASGGNIVVNGNAGHRFGILMKGAQVVVEGVGDLAFEYMTDGTAMILGKVGNGLCTGARGGIVFVYDPDPAKLKPHSDAVRCATAEERNAYEDVMRKMLQDAAPHSTKASEILAQFNPENFSILIPTGLDNIKTLRKVLDVVETYHMRLVPISVGMQVWLEQKILEFDLSKASPADCDALRNILNSKIEHSTESLQRLRKQILGDNHPLSERVRDELNRQLNKLNAARGLPDMEDFGDAEQRKLSVKQKRATEERVSNIDGLADYKILKYPLEHIVTYLSQLTHDAHGCSGCHSQSCAGAGEKKDTGCPSGKPINTINDLLKKIGSIYGSLTEKQWRLLRQAFEAQIESSPFIAYTGAACPAPCESACTESIPNLGDPNPQRDDKLIGEAVHIRNIEWALDQVGRSLGWFDGNEPEKMPLEYQRAMADFRPAFIFAEKIPNKKLVIVGSGPAAMQMAFEALRSGIAVEMYEKSDKAGGLLQDGIPHHKFDKEVIDYHFKQLKTMGLTLYLNSKVDYESEEFRALNLETKEVKVIAKGNESDRQVALCVGSGAPKALPEKITQALNPGNKQKIIQAVDFLKAANDVADLLQKNPNWSDKEKDNCIKEKLGAMDPRGKKIVVLGGGDTAQDAIRWVARYMAVSKNGNLQNLVRGAKPVERSGTYPLSSGKPTAENKMRMEEIKQIGGETRYHEAPISITCNANGQLTITTEKSAYQYYDEIQKNPEAKKLWNALPPEQRPKVLLESGKHQADLVICALGFHEGNTIPIVKNTVGLTNVFVAGDTSDTKAKIIVAAQANASDTWRNKIAPAFGVVITRAVVQQPAVEPKKKVNRASLFANSKELAEKMSRFIPGAAAPARAAAPPQQKNMG